MAKLLLSLLLLFSVSLTYSQQETIVFKKKNKTIGRYWEGTTIAFQLKNLQWQKGEIVKIRNDSFYIKPMIVKYNLYDTDTIHFPVAGFSLKDIYALPKRGVHIDYGNGHFKISISGSHVKWYWIKSGWIFRYGAAGYAGLHIINGLLQNDLSFAESKTELGIAAAVFLGGVVLHKLYKPTLRPGRKYHLEILTL